MTIPEIILRVAIVLNLISIYFNCKNFLQCKKTFKKSLEFMTIPSNIVLNKNDLKLLFRGSPCCKLSEWHAHKINIYLSDVGYEVIYDILDEAYEEFTSKEENK